MKIAVVCPYDMDRPGGVQSHIADTARVLQGLGHDITIIAPSLSEGALPDRLSGVPIRRFGRGRKIPFGGTKFEIAMARGDEHTALKRFLDEARFDLIHYHTIWSPLLPLQVFFASKSANVATFHDTPSISFSGRILKRVFSLMSRFLLKRMDGAIAVSQSPRAHLRPPPDLPVHIIPPCTDLLGFTDTQPKEAGGKTEVDILFLGRLEQRKGARILLEAYRLLKEKGSAVRLTIAGSGEEEPMLRDYIEQYRLADVRFLGPFTDSEKPGLYAACDIFCAPSPFGESFGIVLVEAMASARPVVAAANSGYRTVMTGKAAQFLTPPGDAKAIAEKLKLLVDDAQLRREMGQWGRREALRYDARAVAPRILDIYAEAIKRKAARVRNGI